MVVTKTKNFPIAGISNKTKRVNQFIFLLYISGQTKNFVFPITIPFHTFHLMNQNSKFDSSNNIWIDKFSFIENYQVLSYDPTNKLCFGISET